MPANAGDKSSIPGPRRSHTLWSNEAHARQLLSPCVATTEARAPRARALKQEEPPQWEACAPQRRVFPTGHNWRKATTQTQHRPKYIVKYFFFFSQPKEFPPNEYTHCIVLLGCHNKVSQSDWLSRQASIEQFWKCLRSLRSTCPQGQFLLESVRENLSHAFPLASGALLVIIRFPGGSDGRVCPQCRRPGFDLWVRKIPWRRAWQPTPVFFPGESHGQRSPAGYSPRGRKESDQLFYWVTNPFTFQDCRVAICLALLDGSKQFSKVVSSRAWEFWLFHMLTRTLGWLGQK